LPLHASAATKARGSRRPTLTTQIFNPDIRTFYKRETS
jgi:hypothetical protein